MRLFLSPTSPFAREVKVALAEKNLLEKEHLVAVDEAVTKAAADASTGETASLAFLTLRNRAERLGLAARSLHTVSPLATLERGYAIVSDAAENKVITSVAEARPNQTVRAQLADGNLLARIESVTRQEKK